MVLVILLVVLRFVLDSYDATVFPLKNNGPYVGLPFSRFIMKSLFIKTCNLKCSKKQKPPMIGSTLSFIHIKIPAGLYWLIHTSMMSAFLYFVGGTVENIKHGYPWHVPTANTATTTAEVLHNLNIGLHWSCSP